LTRSRSALQRASRGALSDPSVHAPDGILRMRSPKLGPPDPRCRPWAVWRRGGDAPRGSHPGREHHEAVRFGCGAATSSAAALSLDARLPEVLPADVVGRFPTAAEIKPRMLLSHRSGILMTMPRPRRALATYGA